jgi:hypothetical protein
MEERVMSLMGHGGIISNEKMLGCVSYEWRNCGIKDVDKK